MSPTPIEAVFEGSDERYYTRWEVDRKLRTGVWKPCIRQRDPDRTLVEDENGDLLLLTPVELDELPSWLEIRIGDEQRQVVDTRRPRPP